MTKTEIRDFLATKGGVKSYPPAHRDPDEQRVRSAWKEAVDMMNKAKGTYYHVGCGSCMRHTWEWLQN